jgi:hypothetical protein
MSSAEA